MGIRIWAVIVAGALGVAAGATCHTYFDFFVAGCVTIGIFALCAITDMLWQGRKTLQKNTPPHRPPTKRTLPPYLRRVK